MKFNKKLLILSVLPLALLAACSEDEESDTVKVDNGNGTEEVVTENNETNENTKPNETQTEETPDAVETDNNAGENVSVGADGLATIKTGGVFEADKFTVTVPSTWNAVQVEKFSNTSYAFYYDLNNNKEEAYNNGYLFNIELVPVADYDAAIAEGAPYVEVARDTTTVYAYVLSTEAGYLEEGQEANFEKLSTVFATLQTEIPNLFKLK